MTNNERTLRDAILCLTYALQMLKNTLKDGQKDEIEKEIKSVQYKLGKLE